MNRIWIIPLIALFLTACGDKKTPLTGTRIPVQSFDTSVKPDKDTKDTSILIPLTERGRDWPQAGSAADHKTPNFFLDDPIKLLWKASIGSGNGDGQTLSLPIVAEGRAYALDTYGRVVALDAYTGKRLWRMYISPNEESEAIIGGGLGYANGKLYVTSPHAEVLALDAQNGNILWRYKTQSPVRAAPTLANGRLYALTIGNQLQVLDMETGNPLWNHAGIMEYAGLLGTASPAVSKGVVIVPYSSGEIYALKAENGHQLWLETLTSTRRPDSLSSLTHIRALPIIDENHVIVIGYNQKMANYDLRRGERVWERTIGGIETPAVVGNYIFMINSHNELLCLNRDYGQIIWVKKLLCDPQNPNRVIWQGPIMAGGKLYIVNIHGQLLALDPANGNTLSAKDLDTRISLPPFIAQDTLYLLTDRGDLMAFK